MPCRYLCWAPDAIGIDSGIIKRYIQCGILLVVLREDGVCSAERAFWWVWLKRKMKAKERVWYDCVVYFLRGDVCRVCHW